MATIFPENKEDFTAENGITYTWVDNRWRTKTFDSNEYLPLTGGAIAGNLSVSGSLSNQGGIMMAGPKDKGFYVYDLQGGAVFSAYGDKFGAGVQYFGAVDQPNHVATKSYVDSVDLDDKYLSLNGGTMKAPFSMGNKQITALGDPVQPGQAANRRYVDDNFLSLTAGGRIEGYTQFVDDTKLQMGGTYNNNIIDGADGFTDNGIVATLGYVKHNLNNSVGGGSDSLGAGFNWQFREMGDIRPGEIMMCSSSFIEVPLFSNARMFIWSDRDKDGNRLFPDQNAEDWSHSLSGVFRLFDTKDRVLASVSGGTLAYVKEMAAYVLSWATASNITAHTTYQGITKPQEEPYYVHCSGLSL